MKRIALFVIVCCAVVFSSCNKDPKDRWIYSSIIGTHFANYDNEVSVTAVLDTINIHWKGDENFTDLEAETKYHESVDVILLHGDEIKAFMGADDYFTYGYIKDFGNGSDYATALVIDTKFYLIEDGDLISVKDYPHDV